MTTPKFETGPDPKNPENVHGIIRILDGNLKGIAVRIGSIQLTEHDGTARLTYDVELVEDANNIQPSTEDLREPIGNIITDLIQEYIDSLPTEEKDV